MAAGRNAHDMLVVGGAVAGAGATGNAAGRRRDVLVRDAEDPASHAWSRSWKRVLGVLRRLDHGAVRSVRSTLRRREVRLRVTPHPLAPSARVLPPGPVKRPGETTRGGCRVGGSAVPAPSRGLEPRSGAGVAGAEMGAGARPRSVAGGGIRRVAAVR